MKIVKKLLFLTFFILLYGCQEYIEPDPILDLEVTSLSLESSDGKITYEINLSFYLIGDDDIKIRKVWEHEGFQVCTSTYLLKSSKNNIYGEFRFLNESQDLNSGQYSIKVQYRDDGKWKDIPFASGINNSITI